MVAFQIDLLNWNAYPVLVYSVTVIYSLLFLSLLHAWSEIKKPKSINKHSTEVSVIIALRNEDGNLPNLLTCLSQQHYPEHLTEIILVDDHSNKPVSEHVCFKSNNLSNVNVILLGTGQYGKKAALKAGAQQCQGELIIFTDGDCNFGPNWIACHVEQYVQSKSILNIGLVEYLPGKHWLTAFFNLDLTALVITGASTAQIGHPTMCNGANLSVERSAYLGMLDQLNPQTPSGDDVFLLHDLKRRFPKKIEILKSNDSIVRTAPPATLYSFLNQRIRWGAKAKFYTDSDTILLTFIILVINMLLVTTLAMCLLGKVSWITAAILYVAKTTTDSLYLAAGCKFFGRTMPIWLIPLFEFFYALYICYSAIAGLLNAYQWKGRKAIQTSQNFS